MRHRTLRTQAQTLSTPVPGRPPELGGGRSQVDIPKEQKPERDDPLVEPQEKASNEKTLDDTRKKASPEKPSSNSESRTEIPSVPNAEPPDPDDPYHDLPELVSDEEGDIEWKMGDHLTAKQKADLREMLDEYRDVFAHDMSEMTTVKGETFSIPLTDETPIFRQKYRLSQSENESLSEHIEERLKCGFVRPSTSQWAFPTTMPPKKDEHGNWTLKRPCGDYRELNKVSITDHYPLPTPEEIFDQLEGATWFTTLDLRWGYHQVALDEKDCCKTAFWGPKGLYEWVVMPFGLKNAPAFFQRLMDTTLRAQFEFCRCYIDDVIIFSKSFEEHLVHLRAVLSALRAKRIKCHPKKMRLAVSDVEYLGHFVVPNGTAPQQAKVEAILKMAAPHDVPLLRAFLGTAGYYRRYVRNYSSIAAPLNRLLQKDVPWGWTAEAQHAFEQLKVKLTEAPILRRPNFAMPFELHTDWSAEGLGAVLAQRDEENKEFVVAYASRSNNRTERNYSSYQGECLAAVWGVQIFRVYLYGRHFTLITDHEPLKWLMTNMRLTGMHARWANILQEYDFEIVHRSGLKNLDADGLSRNPLPSDHDSTDARMDHVSEPEVGTISACLARLVSPTADEDSVVRAMPAALPAAPPRDQPIDPELPVNLDRDIWHDEPVMAYLRHGTYPDDATAPEKDRIWHRAQGYHFQEDVLRKRLSSGEVKIVPKPEQRVNLIRRVHLDVGHYGVKKTYSLLEPIYWWVGMYGDVQKEVSTCVVCDRVKATFEVKDPELKPLPIMGMFYRWGIDLFKMPFPSAAGNQYVVVMIEHFSKWIEIAAIPAKTAENVKAAFIEVLARYGAPAEVLTDQGTEFEGLFAALLLALYIDHCITSRDHAQSNGLAERIVQMFKKALRKYCVLYDHDHWDEFLPWIAMGYRFSRHHSLGGYSPYYLLYGRHPIVGARIKDVVDEPINLDSPLLSAQILRDRALLFKDAMPMAFNNLAIAQHRDTLRYAYTRSGDFKPKLKRFDVGDLVYLRRESTNSMEPDRGRIILRVKQLLGTGRLLLEGRDQKTIREHVENCAPCHNPNIDLYQNPALADDPEKDQACEICGLVDVTRKTGPMLLCDSCDSGWHMKCFTPPIKTRPKGDWFCPNCPLAASKT